MKRFFLFTTLLVISLSLWSQSLSVKSFKLLADVRYEGTDLPVKDQNGDVCALIRVLTTESDFSWDGDQLGIVKVEKKNDGYWLYVPYGSKRITIKHDKLGVLRDYNYPEPIVTGAIYEMVLSGERLKTIVVDQKEVEAAAVWLIVKSVPVGADFYVNDVNRGVTPLTLKLTNGNYSYRLEKPKYNILTGPLSLTGEEPDGKKEISLTMKLALGVLKINSSPEAGASVYLDGVEMKEKTPVALENLKVGRYQVVVKKEMFLTANEEIVFNDNDTIQRTFQLKPNFGNVTVSAQPDAVIYIDSMLIGKGLYKNRIVTGVHTFEARKENVKYKKLIKTIQSGDDVVVTLVVQTDQGCIDINSDPVKANVFINGVNYGRTPFIQKKIAIGTYQVRLEKEGYETLNMPIIVEEGITSPHRVSLIPVKKAPVPIDSARIVQKINPLPKDSIQKVSPEPKDSVKTIDKIQKQVGVTWKKMGSTMKQVGSKMKQVGTTVESKVKKIISKDSK